MTEYADKPMNRLIPRVRSVLPAKNKNWPTFSCGLKTSRNGSPNALFPEIKSLENGE